jgi:hypothetical protein
MIGSQDSAEFLSQGLLIEPHERCQIKSCAADSLNGALQMKETSLLLCNINASMLATMGNTWQQYFQSIKSKSCWKGNGCTVVS